MSHTHTEAFISRCINDTLAGLREGLTQFSGPSRSAVIFSISPNDPLLICDPQNLLWGYQPKLIDAYINNNDWRQESYKRYDSKLFGHIDPDEDLELDGIICYGGRSGAAYYQMWFTEHHPDMCSTGPTRRWLEHAVLRFSHDLANEANLYTGISGSFLREFATHAVHDYVVDLANLNVGIDSSIRIFPLLESILGISKTPEEGKVPFGNIVFIEPRFLDQLRFVARFQQTQQPSLNHYKHIRKLLLTVEDSPYSLVSDGSRIIGICDYRLPDFHITAQFKGKNGFLHAADETVCSFADGRFRSTTHQAKLFEVEEILLDYDMDTTVSNGLFQIISYLVHNAQLAGHGSTFVIDLEKSEELISGQVITPPIDLKKAEHLELACGLSKTDGALHIMADQHLHAFACILDGLSIPHEERARGARYNSALRFTAQNRDSIVIVVSSDNPVSVIYRGKDMGKEPVLTPHESCSLYPGKLRNWLACAG